MSSLTIRPGELGSEAAFVELVSTGSDVQKGSLRRRESVDFDVEPGVYLLRAHWSDGRRTQQVVDIGDGDLALELPPPTTEAPSVLELGDPVLAPGRYMTPSRPEAWDQVPRAAQEATETDAGRRRRSMGVIFTPFPSIAEPADEPPFTVWRKEGESWRNVGLNDEPRPIEGGFEFDLNVGEGLHVFQASRGGQTQFTSIPAERSIIALRWHRKKHRLYLRVDARTSDRDIEALRGYILRGELEVASGLASNVMAERFLRSKIAAPRVAALGAYFLLRIGDLDRLHDWPDNLSRWKKWLPDGPVISAWQRLRSPEPDYEEAFGCLVEAERRGVPVYTEGVRLLKDGLDLFASDAERNWDVDLARDRVEAYARAMLWNKSETTYFGSAPDAPQPYQSAEGVPWGVVDEQEMPG